MQHTQTSANAESAGAIMSTNLPTCRQDTTVDKLLNYLSGSELWDTVHFVYVVDGDKKLLGQILISKILQSTTSTLAKHIMERPKAILHPQDDRERAVFLAIKDDVDSIPVVDHAGILLGAVGPKAIIEVMHAEHLEDNLLSAGVRRSKSGHGINKLATGGLGQVLASRAPWLVFGAAAGLGLGLISSFFEASLEKSIALAYFIPVVAYIADSVGTQSEAITIRALTVLKISYGRYLVRETIIGLLLGILLGSMGGVGAALISHEPLVGVTVTLSLITASTVASVLAALIPIAFKALGKDPALGSGPLATAIQDLISVVVYFLFAVWIIG